MTGKLPTRRKDLPIDTYALNHAYIIVTPMQCDLTDDRLLGKLGRMDLKM